MATDVRASIEHDGQMDHCERESLAVVVTGIPGSGKTTLAQALALAWEVPVLALDAIKERLYESSDGALIGFQLRLTAESELRAQLVASHGPAVVDIWIQPGRDTARVAELLTSSTLRVVEVLCRVPAEVAIDRYRRRVRFGPHKPADEETLQRIRHAADALVPLGVGPCFEIDTSAPVAVERLLELLS